LLAMQIRVVEGRQGQTELRRVMPHFVRAEKTDITIEKSILHRFRHDRARVLLQLGDPPVGPRLQLRRGMSVGITADP
jgi:hypothetical protein